MNQHEDHHVDAEALSRGHELRESNVRLIVKFGIGLVVLTVFSYVLMWGLFEFVADYNSSTFRKDAPLTELNQIPPQPHLQVLPEADLAKMRAEETKKMETYNWVIRTADIVQIPIQRAMQLTADDERFKLPIRPSEPSEAMPK